MPALPIDSLLPKIGAFLKEKRRLVIQAPPGAGKTSRVPAALLEMLPRGRILVLQPRRLAVKLAAGYLAEQRGEAPGETVGYSLRLERRIGARTRIEFLTYGLFLRRLQVDPALSGIAAVIFDECHERSVDQDLALAFLLESLDSFETGPLLIAMSATLEAGPLSALIGDAPCLTAEGRSYPIAHLWRPPQAAEALHVAIAKAVTLALREGEGDILVFLPGEGEIRRSETTLREQPATVDCLVSPLYGRMERRAQEAVLRPDPNGRRKVVLATAIAETSLTIEGVRCVVDSGLAREPRFDPRRGITVLETRPASQATAAQRSGRAGRLGPGLCIRLWDEKAHGGRPRQPQPEILSCDPLPLAMELVLWGAPGGAGLRFLDPPPPGPLAGATASLTEIGALDSDGRPTPYARRGMALGLHPRLAVMIAKAEDRGQLRTACDLAAILSSGGSRAARGGADLLPLIDRLRQARPDGALAEAAKLSERWRAQLKVGRSGTAERADSASLAGLLALAYPERLARLAEARGRVYRMAAGGSAALAEEDPLYGSPWLAIAEISGGAMPLIRLAAALSQEEALDILAGRIDVSDQVTWNAQQGRVEVQRLRRAGAILLSRQDLAAPDPEAVQAALLDGIREAGLACLPWTEAARRLQARIAFLASHDEGAWPDLSDAALADSLEIWLVPYLSGCMALSDLAALDLRQLLLDRLDYAQQRALDRLAPERIVIGSGRAVNLDYSSDPPVLAAKLQEFFGMEAIPSLAGGVAPSLHLLSPAGRPLQVTRDLPHFWRNGYAAVRAEMRGRYPKHPWPEDPLSAPATAKTKRRLTEG